MGARKQVSLWAAVLPFLLAAANVSNAATYNVTKTADTNDGVCDTDCSLREAIIAANATSEPDEVQIPPGTYTLTIEGVDEDSCATGDLDILEDLEIVGLGTPDNTIIDGGGIDRVIDSLGYAIVSISSVAITRGAPPRLPDSPPSWELIGAGIRNATTASMTILNSKFVNNGDADYSLTFGGAIANEGSLSISHTRIEDNFSLSVSAGIDNNGSLNISDSIIRGNRAPGLRGGGGIRNHSRGRLLLSYSDLGDNWGGYPEGGPGDNFYNDGGEVVIHGSTISGGYGGIFSSGHLRMTDSTVSNQSGYTNCVGIKTTGTAVLTNTTVNGNSAYEVASGICNSGRLAMVNSTVSGNRTGFGVGGILNYPTGEMIIVSSTVTDNSNDIDVGAVAGIENRGVLLVKNSLVANQSCVFGDCSWFSPGADCANGGTIISLGNNIDSDGTCGFTGPGDMTTDPLLEPLADNGGLTLTHALQLSSPALDAIEPSDCTYDDDDDPNTPEVPLSQDQRGSLRPWGAGCDIGAFEVDGRVAGCLLADDFNSVAVGADPLNWLDTGSLNSMTEVDLFEVLNLGGERAFGTSSTLVNIHSHYVTLPESATWSDYTYTGRFRFSHPNSGLGITVLSQYNSRDAYYRLRRYVGRPGLYFSAHGTAEPSGGCETGVATVPNVWYRFKIEAEDTGAATALRAKVWEDGTAEPASFQTTGCVDASPTRLTVGTVGVWSMGAGVKYWDDLAVGVLGECVNDGPPVCGNGILESGEECDDGNTVEEDGCSPTCELEFCGDGIVQPGLGEECEFTGDCPGATLCGFDCVCYELVVCGNGAVEEGEDCDDGNTVGGDCCSVDCLYESAGSSCGNPTDDVCTDPDTCNGAGTCQENHTPDGTSCDTGDACTVGATCSAGICVGGSLPDCTPFDDECNTASCRPGGTLWNCDIRTPRPDGTSCDDGNVCLVGESCQAGSCMGGVPPDCSAFGDQCNAASCDPSGANGNCDLLIPVGDGTSCNDEIACTEGDQCDGGVCTGVANDTLCDDEDPCNGIETCNVGLGRCQSGPPVECPPGQICHPATGECVVGSTPPGLALKVLDAAGVEVGLLVNYNGNWDPSWEQEQNLQHTTWTIWDTTLNKFIHVDNTHVWEAPFQRVNLVVYLELDCQGDPYVGGAEPYKIYWIPTGPWGGPYIHVESWDDVLRGDYQVLSSSGSLGGFCENRQGVTVTDPARISETTARTYVAPFTIVHE